MITSIVPGETTKVAHDASIAEYGLDSEHLGSGITEANGFQASGICCDGASDRGAATTREIDSVHKTGPRGCLLHDCYRHASAHSRQTEVSVYLWCIGQSPKADHHLAVQRHASSDQAGVAALRDNCDARRTAGRNHRSHLVGAARADDCGRAADETAGPVARMTGNHVWIGKNVPRADHIGELAKEWARSHS